MAPVATNGIDMRPKPAPLSVGIVGIGHRGYYTHFLASLEQSRTWIVSAVCDVSKEALGTFSSKHPDVPAYNCLDELLCYQTLDFAIVCVPHRAHLECCTKLANAGIPILKEKPVAASWEEYGQLLQLPVKIGVMFQKRFEPRYLALQNLLPQIGQVATFRATLAENISDLDATWRAEQGVSVTVCFPFSFSRVRFWTLNAVQEDLGCHMLDVVIALFGKPTSVTAQNAKGIRKHQYYGGDDVSNIIMNFGENHMRNTGHVHLSRVSHRKEESFVVTGTEGTLILEGKEVTMRDVAGNETFHLRDTSAKKHAVTSMVQSFANWIQGNSNNFITSFADLKDIVRVAEAITISSRNPGTTEVLNDVSTPLFEASLDGEHHVWPLINRETETEIVRQMHSSLSIYDRSDIYETFENRWCQMHNLEYSLVCSSGTVAIFHMFEALDLRPGDEILCPVYTFFATASPMLQYGATPIFCDILPDGNLDPEELEKRATQRTKAVIVTHMWGLPCKMRQIVEKAAKINGGIRVLEDCSHAHGAIVEGRLVGTWGDMAAWSLQAKKNITGGQAGVFATKSMDYYARAILHGHFNKRAKQEVPNDHPLRQFWLTGLGLNLRAHTLAIALANQQLDVFEYQNQQRQRYTSYMADRLSIIPFLKMPRVADDSQDRHAWYAFVMQFDTKEAPHELTREDFVQKLQERGLKEVDVPKSTGLLNALPLFTHSHVAIPRFGSKPWHEIQPTTDFPIAETFYQKAIKLPVWATERDQPIVEHYIRTFLSVAEELTNSNLTNGKIRANGFH